MTNEFIKKHHEIYPFSKDIALYFSPGRVNLIGEHIDYNGGYVFPFALSIGNYGTFSFRQDEEVHLYSDSFREQGIQRINLSELKYKKEDEWSNYVKGVIYYLKKKGCLINRGFNISIFSTLPRGAGLSSSASIEALVAVMMNDEFHLGLDRKTLALLTQEVENKYIHVHCGIMDQFVILNGEEDAAIMLNTSTLAFNIVPLRLENESIVIINSKRSRGLMDTAYNKRKQECERALSFFQQFIPINNLCEVSIEQLVQYENQCKDSILIKRARHVITEQHRVLETKKALENNDLLTVGKLINESHISLRDDFQVSVFELDLLVKLALHHHALGARMTGAGFGGCTVNIVSNQELDSFIENVKNQYFHETGYFADFYIAKASNKTSRISGESNE